MKRFRLAWVLLVPPILMLLLARSATAGANERQYRLLALSSHEAALFLKSPSTRDDRVPCKDGVLNTTIVCQRDQNKAAAYWIIHTQEGRIGLAAEQHSFEADPQNMIASDCVYVDDGDVNSDEDFGWECATYMALTQPFRVQFPPGSTLDESGELLFSINLSKFKILVTSGRR